ALRSLEQQGAPFRWSDPPGDPAELLRRCASPHDGRLTTMHQAIRAGAGVAELAAATGIAPWFVNQIKVTDEKLARLAGPGPPAAPGRASAPAAAIRAAKASGFSDAQIGQLW